MNATTTTLIWTPVQRIHQMNDYLSRTEGYRHRGYWMRLLQTFFVQHNRQFSVTITITDGTASENRLFDLAGVEASWLHKWAGQEGATRFGFTLMAVSETQASDQAIALEAQLTWTTDYDHGLCVCRQRGTVRVTFDAASAKITEWHWTVGGHDLFFSSSLQNVRLSEDAPTFLQEDGGFPRSILQFMLLSDMHRHIFWLCDHWWQAIPDLAMLPSPQSSEEQKPMPEAEQES
jgi:hypothetical protein